VCALSECIRTVFCVWPDDGFFEPKHIAEFLILFTIYIVVLLTGINYHVITINNRTVHIKTK